MNVTIAIGLTLFLGVFYSWTSRLNGIFFFGRSAGQELRDSPEGKAIQRRYLLSVIAITGLAVFLAWFGTQHGRHFGAIGLMLEAVMFWVIFARANSQVRALEVSRGEIATRESVVQVPLLETPSYSVPGLLVTILPALLAMVAFAVALVLARHGMDWRASWSTWTASSDLHNLDGLLGMSLGLLVSATVFLLVFRRSVRLRTRMAQYSVRASRVIEWLGLALFLAVLACNYLGQSVNRHIEMMFAMAGFTAVLATIVWNQARAKRFVPPPVELGADDRWRWGLFYVDREDPALFVQSRCGAGYTLNYGRMMAWPISLGFVAYLVTMLFLPSRH